MPFLRSLHIVSTLAALAAATCLYIGTVTDARWSIALAVLLGLCAWAEWGRETPTRSRHVWKTLARSCVFASLGVIGLALAGWWFARPTEPDAFYAALAPSGAPPGTLLALEPFEREVPANARAWRMRYATTRAGGELATATAIVLVGQSAIQGPRAVLAWAHGTTGVVPGCAPSLLARPFDCVPALDQLVSKGWVVVGTDYVGLGTAGPHPYLIGDGEARAVLDAIRAVAQHPELEVDARTIVWGHSQGGHAALWTTQLATSYAPDVRIVGAAVFAPATDLVGLIDSIAERPIGRIMSAFVATAYSAHHDDVVFDEWIRPRARVVVRDIAGRCLAAPEALFSALEALALLDGSVFTQDPTRGTLGAHLAENTPRPPPGLPLFVAQGEDDDLVLPSVQDAYVATLSGLGESTVYRTYPGRDHLSLVASGSPLESDVIAWTTAQFAAASPTSGD